MTCMPSRGATLTRSRQRAILCPVPAKVIYLDEHREAPPKEGLHSELTAMLLNLAAMLRDDDGDDDGPGIPGPVPEALEVVSQ